MKGFTLIEVLVVVTILIILTGFSVVSLTSFGRSNNIDSEYSVVVSSLRQVESNSLSNLGDNQWGVHLESNRLIIFNAGSYDPNDSTNKVKLLANGVSLSWDLSGGGQDILFDKGKTTTASIGTITVSGGGVSKQIAINSEGRIE